MPLRIFQRPGSAPQAQPFNREAALRELGEKASDEELALLVKLFGRPHIKAAAINQARKYLT